jgi:hypothetical protein
MPHHVGASRERPSPRRPFGGIVPYLGLVMATGAVAASCGSVKPAGSAQVTTGRAGVPVTSTRPARPTPLIAPKTSPAQDAEYFADLAKADAPLASYVQAQGNVALRALLTDGSAFCAFLARAGGIDNAMAAVVVGARTVEKKTHLPSTVTTFNAIDAVALVALCPSEQKLVPGADQVKIRRLAAELDAEPSSYG